MPTRIAGFAALSNQTLQFQHPKSGAFLPKIKALLVVQSRLDNLPAHKVASVREAIRATGASLLYPPDLNPLEQLLAKLPVSAVKPRMLGLEDRKSSPAAELQGIETPALRPSCASRTTAWPRQFA